MSELIRKIEIEDISYIQRLLKSVTGADEYESIQRLGGMTNRSYRVEIDEDEVYLIRIPGEGTADLINRADEKKSTELACRLGIDSELLYFDDLGYKVMRFIQQPQDMCDEVMKEEKNIRRAADIFRKLHRSGVDTGVRFEVFEMADSYEKIIHEHRVDLFQDYEIIRNEVMEIKKGLDKVEKSATVPCHNDCLIGNWVLSGTGQLYLIDWEYAGMNDPMWDLSCLSIEIGYNEVDDHILLEEYFGRPATIYEVKKFIAGKMYVDFLWTLWGLTRVPYDGGFMQEYANDRYERLKRNIVEFKSM